MQMYIENEPWADVARSAAAKHFGTKASAIVVELDGNEVIINWQGSMTAAPETRKAVEKAVQESLPPEHKGKRVSVV